MDVKGQFIKDLAIFHNLDEFAEMVNLWYCGNSYTVSAVIDHMTAENRTRRVDDHAEGIHRAEVLVYISLADLGFIPKKGRTIEIEEYGEVSTYEIIKASHEYGEITLELEAFDE